MVIHPEAERFAIALPFGQANDIDRIVLPRGEIARLDYDVGEILQFAHTLSLEGRVFIAPLQLP
jgi:hypothetical protein